MQQQEQEQNKPDQICKVFKLSNGETIICMVTKETPSYIEVEVPFRLNMIYTPHGTVNLAIMKWDHTMNYDQPIRVYKNSIVAVADPDVDMYRNYTGMINAVPGEPDEEEDESVDSGNTEIDKIMTNMLHNFKSDKMH